MDTNTKPKTTTPATPIIGHAYSIAYATPRTEAERHQDIVRRLDRIERALETPRQRQARMLAEPCTNCGHARANHYSIRHEEHQSWWGVLFGPLPMVTYQRGCGECGCDGWSRPTTAP